MDNHNLLIELVKLWVINRPFGSIFDIKSSNIDVPKNLLNTITNQEPYRKQVLQDAQIYLSIPIMYGIGMEIKILSSVKTTPFAYWEQTISPLETRVSWSQTMSGDYTDFFDISFDRVVFEKNIWKLASIWDDKTRKETLKQITLLKEFKNKAHNR